MTIFWNKSRTVFSGFIIVIYFVNVSQPLPHPLLIEQPPVIHIPPFADPTADESSSELISSSSSSDEMISFEPSSGGGGNNKKETRDIHGRGGDPEVLCSLFQTFLDARNVNCRYTRQPQFEGPPPSSDDQGILNDQRDGPPSNDLLESNNLLPPGDHLIPSDFEANSRIDSLPDENGEDETKIIRSKTMIIVPERSCPPGKRRDVRGYCRTVIIRFANGPARGGPLRFYYRRLHFILP